MKRTKKVALIALIIMSTILCTINVNATEQWESNFESEKRQALLYVMHSQDEIYNVLKECKEYLDISDTSTQNLHFASPFIILDLDDSIQETAFIFPLLDKDNEIIACITTIGSDKNDWKFCIDTEYKEGLSKINLNSKYYVIESDENIFICQDNKLIPLIGIANSKINSFANLSLTEKESLYYKIDDFSRVPNQIDYSDDLVDAIATTPYAPLLTTTSTMTQCDLFNKQGQGDLNLCWAATAATIANYRLGTSFSATDVADYLNINYASGGQPSDANTFLSHVGVKGYSVHEGDIITVSKIKKNINNKYPIYQSARTTNLTLGHAVTIYGYKRINQTTYVIHWNSGINGKGATQIIEYSGNGSTFSYASHVFQYIGRYSSRY